MLRIRLQRRGRKKRPIHHIVVADSRKPRDGRIIEDLGRFDNITPKNQLELNRDRAVYWLEQGAQPSDTIRSIFKKQGIMYEMHLIRWGKTDEEIEEALTEWREKREAKEEKVPTRKERQQALLEAEEKEFQKQLKKKAEEAAREKAKQEALAAAEEERERAAEKEAESEIEASEEDGAEEPQEEKTQAEGADAGEQESEPEEEVEAQEEPESGEDEEDQSSEAKDEEDTADEEPAVETQDEDEEISSEEEERAEQSGAQVSSEMLAKDAISHIEDTPLNDLEGFVTEDEDRVTVRRAWEDKNDEEE